jgi:drug/metabolite transporter (DMT)-like permease
VTKLIKSTVLTGSLAICVSAILWGLDGIALTPHLYNLNIGFVVFIVHFIPFVIMNTFLFREYRLLSKLSLKDIILLSLVALTGGAVGTMAIVKALFLVEFQDLSVVVLLQKLQPVFAITLAYFFLGEKMRERFFLWAGIAIIASYFLTFGVNLPNLKTGSRTALAAGYSLLAAFAFGSATVLGKSVLSKFTFYSATFFRYGFTSFFMLVFIMITGNIKEVQFVTPHNWVIILIIAFTVGSGAIFLYYYGLRKVPAMLATICELCFPLSAIVFDYVFNDRLLSPIQWLSAAIMLYAIIRLTISPVAKVQKENKKKSFK